MDRELEDLLKQARGVQLSEAQLEEHRIALVAANGYLTDNRITVETVKATRTLMKAAEEVSEK